MTEPEVIEPIRDAELPGCEQCKYGIEEEDMIVRSTTELAKERSDFSARGTDASKLHLCSECERILPTDIYKTSF